METRDWARLSSYIVNSRIASGFETQEQFADAIGLSTRSVQNFEAGKPIRRSNLAKLEQALGWEPGSASSVLAGGRPVVAVSVSGEASPENLPDAETFDPASAPVEQMARVIAVMLDSGEYTDEDIARVIARARELRSGSGLEQRSS